MLEKIKILVNKKSSKNIVNIIKKSLKIKKNQESKSIKIKNKKTKPRTW